MSSSSNKLTPEQLADILSLSGIPFVKRTYLAILHRPADAAGQRTYARSLLRGGAKEDVLVSLRLSQEGRAVGVSIPDFARMRFRRNLRQILRTISPRILGSRLRQRLFVTSSGTASIPREEVVACFRLFFRRHPDEEEVLDHQLGYPSVSEMLAAMCTSEEFMTCNEDVLLAYFETKNDR
jgi:hypothetical protein